MEKPDLLINENIEKQKPILQDRIIELTKEESDCLSGSKEEQEATLKLMKEKGIEFDTGDLVIKVDGENHVITTREDDFGTWLEEETFVELYGQEKADEIYGPKKTEEIGG